MVGLRPAAATSRLAEWCEAHGCACIPDLDRTLSWANLVMDATFVDLVALLSQEVLVREEYRELARVRMSFMWWRYLHIPAAISLGLLVIVHVWTVMKY